MIHASAIKPLEKHPVKSARALRRPQRLTLSRDDQGLLRQHLLVELSRGERAAADIIELLARRLQVAPFPSAVMLIQVDTLANPPNGLDGTQREIIREHIYDVIKSVSSELPASIIGDDTNDRLVVIASPGPRSPLSETELHRTAENLCQSARINHRETLTVGIGTVCNDERSLVASYRDAKEALSYQLFLGNDRVITWKQVLAFVESPSEPEHYDLFSVQEERKLRERIIAGDKKGAFQALDILLDSIREQAHLTPLAFKSHLLQTVIVTCRSAERIGADVRALTDRNIHYAETILETDSYPALRAFMHALVEDVIHATLGRGRTPKGDVVLMAKKYIAENYAKSPSLREVANFVHLSPHYFSRVFGEENDCGFQDYLNKVRIEAAKDLLRNSPIKVKQAARRVGFKDVSHFARLFRRVEGMTPAEFTRSVGQVKI